MRKKCLFLVTNLLLLASLFFLVSCSNSTKQTVHPTATPTLYFVHLPTSIQSSLGWKLTLSLLELRPTLNAKEPNNQQFLVGLLDVENLTGKSACIKSDQFILHNGAERIKMERDLLEAGKSTYDRDYPGTILGQCFEPGEKQTSILVFDIPDTNEELTLFLQDQPIKLGKIQAIQNLPPTETPMATASPIATITPLPTDTLLPTDTPLPTKTFTPEPTTTPLSTEDSYGILIKEKVAKYVQAFLDVNEYVQQAGNDTSLLVDSEWKTEFGFALGILNSQADEMAKLEPTPKYANLHSIIVKLANETYLYTDDLSDGFDNFDSTLIEKANQHMINMTTLAKEVTEVTSPR